MALTPEDVVNKRFNPTKFREGYDQDEVDDFLDEVVVELRRLNQENEELRQRLVAGEARINELQRSASAAPQAAPAAPEPAFAAPADAASMDPNNTNNLLQLARRLHEEHVRGTLGELAARYADVPPRGECTLVVAGAPAAPAAVDVEAELRKLLDEGLGPRDAAARLVIVTGKPRRQLYQLALSLRPKQGSPR